MLIVAVVTAAVVVVAAVAQFDSVQFSSALGKVHKRSNPSFPNGLSLTLMSIQFFGIMGRRLNRVRCRRCITISLQCILHYTLTANIDVTYGACQTAVFVDTSAVTSHSHL